MDIFHQANKLKPRADKVKQEEFYNDALNRDVDLNKQATNYYKEWTAAQKKGQVFDRHSFFTLFNYPWSLNAYKKSELFNVMASQGRYNMINEALLENIGLGGGINSLNNIFMQAHFQIKIRRDNLLEDSLNNLVNRDSQTLSKLLRKPMRVYFEGEPAIDEGGVKKEYFQLVFKELFNPDWGMFNYNPDNRLYWFNGKTFENPLKFELVGTLLGLAASN